MSAEIPSGLGVLQRIQEVLEKHGETTKRIPHPRSKRLLLNLDACTGCDWTSEEDGQHTAHVAALVLASLTSGGYMVMRPVTTEEEAANQ